MSNREFMPFDLVIDRTLGDIAGLAIADIGCGSGTVTRKLAARGADVVGVEPNAAQVEKAEALGGGPRYLGAPAEATGLDSQSLDVVPFSRSLHHAEDMDAALREACRILKPSGRIAVLEPDPDGPFTPVMAYVDDETAVYAQAQAALEAAVAAGLLERGPALRYATKYRVADVSAMLADLITVDSGRALAEADRGAFEAAFAAAHISDEKGGYIPDWSRMDVFTRV